MFCIWDSLCFPQRALPSFSARRLSFRASGIAGRWWGSWRILRRDISPPFPGRMTAHAGCYPAVIYAY
ncbi:hypothetical protein KCP73_17945 [Salmonella enterica subsp. enterica]|nr:hypothetical protein KCP73_17945 [Salmonella enterica subsp. enterica]